VRQQDAYPANGGGAVTTMCYTPQPFQGQHFHHSLHASYLLHSRDQE